MTKNRGTPSTRPRQPTIRYKKITNYRSKRAKKNDKRVNMESKNTYPEYLGYKKVAVKKAWEEVNFSSYRKITCWRHPVHKSVHFVDNKPDDITVYKWVSTTQKANIKPVPGYDFKTRDIEIEEDK